LHKRIDPESKKRENLIGNGLAASPGGAVGRIVFNADDAVEWEEQGEDVILCRV
jgi:pyruvate,orthophosphate dikinase